MRILHRPNSPELKFIAYNLYPLPPFLKPCELVETIYTRYLNKSHAPIINPLKKSIHIELYNEKWFDKPLKTSIPPFLYKHNTMKSSIESIFPFPSVVELHSDTNTCPPKPLVEAVNDTLSTPPSPLKMDSFIQYIPEVNIKPRRFLIQVNHIKTTILKMDSSHAGDYHVTFLSRHLDDNHLCDDLARWWS